MSTYYFVTITTFERFDEEHILHKNLKLQSWHLASSWCAWRPPPSPRSPPSRASGSWEGCPASSCLLVRWDPKDDKDGGESDDDGGGGNEDDKIHTTLPNVFFRECQYIYQRSAWLPLLWTGILPIHSKTLLRQLCALCHQINDTFCLYVELWNLFAFLLS